MTNNVTRYILQNHVLATALILLLGWFLLQIRDILVVVFIAYIIMAALAPLVHQLTKLRIPHVVAALISYFTVLSVLGLIIFPLIPFFVSQLEELFFGFPQYVDRATKILGLHVDLSQINQYILNELDIIGKNAFSLTKSLFTGLFSMLTVFVISFYLVIDQRRINKALVSFLPSTKEQKASAIVQRIEDKLGAWLRGQIVLSIFIGSLTWIVLTLLGLPYALPLALIAGILEIVPTIGPIVSAIPAIIVALTINPAITIAIVVAYIGIQMLENNILVPKIMEKAVGLNPVIIILSVMIGAKLMGVLGALLAVPFVALLVLVYQSFTNQTD